MKPEYRCINIDWLECYCLEPISEPHDPDYYRDRHYDVSERDYGTPNYEQMFTIVDHRGYGILEVRRKPKGKDGVHTILPINACHIRLTNRSCYSSKAIDIMRTFCDINKIEIVRVSRIDICCDFERFDSGDDPARFVARYIKGKYSKINQSKGYGRFEDTWSKREWNSLSWGETVSPIRTKIYDKTKELKEQHDKPYIKDAWFNCHLVDNPLDCSKKRKDGSIYYPTIWRLEFSIQSGVRGWVTINKDGSRKKKQSYRNNLDMYDSPDKLLTMFMSLANHYFHFKHYQYGIDKYNCPDKVLFDFTGQEQYYLVEHPSSNQQVNTAEMRLKKYLMKYKAEHLTPDQQAACDLILSTIQNEDTRRYLSDPYDPALLKALQLAIQMRIEGSQADPAKLVQDLTTIIKNSPKLF